MNIVNNQKRKSNIIYKFKKRTKSTKNDSDDTVHDSDSSSSEYNNDIMFFKTSNDDVYVEDNHIYFRTGVNKKSMEKLIKCIRNLNYDFKELKVGSLLRFTYLWQLL